MKTCIIVFTVPDNVPKLTSMNEIRRACETVGLINISDSNIYSNNLVYEIHLEFPFSHQDKSFLSKLERIVSMMKKYSPIINL